MDFVTGLSVSPNWKGKTYDFILVIIDQLVKMIYYKLVKITLDALGVVKVVINRIVRHYRLPNSIVGN